MDENQVRQIIKEELAKLTSAERWVFQQHVQMFDGKNIQLAKGTGTKIGTETTQKLGFFDAIPVDQPDIVNDPAAEVGSLAVRVAEIIDRLQELGLISST